MSDASLPSPTPTVVGRRRPWLRRVLLLLGGLGLLLLAAPLYAGKLLAPFLVSTLEERLGARAELDGVSFAWPARLTVRGLELRDAAGAPLASLDALEGALELGPLLSGELRATLDVRYPELHLARAADGRWNFESALAHALAGADTREETPPDAGAELPRVALALTLTDGHLIVHGVGGDTTLADIECSLALDGLDRPAPYGLSFGVRGPNGPAGRVELAGEFTAALRGKLEPSGLAARARLALEEIDLAAFAPAAELLFPLEGLRGRAGGTLELALGEGLALEGTSDLALSGIELVGPLSGGEPTRIAEVRLSGTATQQGEGAGTQRFELAAERFLTLTYAGESNVPAAGAGSLAGELTVSGDLGRLVELARAWVPLQAGVLVQGRLEQRLELGARFADRAPTAATLTLGGGLTGLAARDAGGRSLDLSNLAEVTLALEAEADLVAGTLRAPKIALAAGPVSFEGHLEARGVTLALDPAALVLTDAAFDLGADLEALRTTLAQLVPLEEGAFGGKVRALGTLRGAAAGDFVLDMGLEARALALVGMRLASCDGRLTATRTPGGALTGGGHLGFGASHFVLAEGTLALPGAELTLELAEDASGVGRHRLVLASADDALALNLTADSTRNGANLGLAGALALDGDVARLAALAEPLVAAQPGLAGALRGTGEFRVELAESAPRAAGLTLGLELDDLRADGADGKPLALEALARTKLALEADWDAGTQRAELKRLALSAGGLELTGQAVVAGLAPGSGFAPAALEITGGKLRLALELERLGAELARVVDLGGVGFGGSALELELDLEAREGRAEARGKLAAERLRLTQTEGAAREFAPLTADFDLGFDLALASLHVRTARFVAGGAEAELAGTLNELADPAHTRGTMTLAVSAELGRLLGELGLEDETSGRKTSGRLTGEFKLDGDQGAFEIDGTSTLADFRLELAPTAEGEEPFVVSEERIALTLGAGVTLPAVDVVLEKLALDSGLARGGARGTIKNLAAFGREEVLFEGLTGEFVYVPDRLGAVLAPFLPGKLSGAEEQRLTLVFDGRASEFSLERVLASSTARVDLGLGTFVRPEVALDGRVTVEARDGKAFLSGALGANGGTLALDGELDLAPEKPVSHLKINAKDVKANSGLAPLLALAHPAFAASSLTTGTLEGVLGLTLDVTYEGPLSLDGLAQGWDSLPKEPISGSGSLSLSGAGLRGSPLLAALAEFGVDVEKDLELRPIDFTIKKGRLAYARPWTWTIGGAETSFTGSVGLDQTLALDWNLPITPELVQKYDFLAALAGEKISVPIRGTALAPRLDTKELLKDLAAKAAKKALTDRLGLGGGDSATGDDPDSLLKQADELWTKGKKAEAAKIYTRLKEDYKLSLTYALNKDRIKDRAKFKE